MHRNEDGSTFAKVANIGLSRYVAMIFSKMSQAFPTTYMYLCALVLIVLMCSIVCLYSAKNND